MFLIVKKVFKKRKNLCFFFFYILLYKVLIQLYYRIGSDNMDLEQNNISNNVNNNSVYDLPVDILPELTLTKGKTDLVDDFTSILEKSLNELVSMDIEDLRSSFINEIKSLEKYDEFQRYICLEKVFSLLFDIQPDSYSYEFDLHEQRLYADLISTPGLTEIGYVVDFINEKYGNSGSIDDIKGILLKHIFDYYSTHSKEACDKFNYIFRSSVAVGISLLKDDNKLGFYFSDEAMSSFSKEDLSQMFRFFYRNIHSRSVLSSLFDPVHHKSLFMISQMNKKIKTLTGHSAEYLHYALRLFSEEKFYFLLEDVYDKIVGSEENEKNFDLSSIDNSIIIRELINYISLGYEKGNLSYIFKANTMEEFLNMINENRDTYHTYIFKSRGISKIKNGEVDKFNFDKDFKSISNYEDLENFKIAFLYNIYGISLDFADYIKEHYGKYINELEKELNEKDATTFEVLKSIINIVDVDHPNLKQKLNTLRKVYLDKITEKGLNYQNNNGSAIVLEGLLNRMYLNTYNKILTKVSDKTKIIKYDDGVPIYDAGLEFNFLLTALGGGTDDGFFDKKVNMSSKWNTAFMSDSQGLCTSFINNENLGVISLASPILGFVDIPKDALNMMGSSDVFTATDHFDLRESNNGNDWPNRYFVPASIMADQTRYGYNEILLDRFLTDDEQNKLKLQPDYIIYYKFSDDYYEYDAYKNSLKIAKECNVPMIIIDVLKVKANEQDIIEKKQKELFSSIEPKPELLNEIVTRYMNNYTGALTMLGEKKNLYLEEFSVNGMKEFFTKLQDFICSINDESLKSEWIINFENIYLEEKKKYKESSQVTSWAYSVKNFILDDTFKLNDSFLELKKLLSDEFKQKKSNDKKDIPEREWEIDYDDFPEVMLPSGRKGIFLTEKSFSPVAKVIIELISYFDTDTTFELRNYNLYGNRGVVATGDITEDDESMLIEEFLCCYLLGDCSCSPLEDLVFNYFDINLNVNLDGDFDFVGSFMNSAHKPIVIPNDYDYINYNHELAEKYISTIESINDSKFLEIFSPIIEEQTKKEGKSYEVIASMLLDRKSSIRNNFERLSIQIDSLKNNNGLLEHNDVNSGKKSI